ncbi:CPBP family intramembrane glutamic endopeptidase [Natrarchaeobius sp. A-rgal3]|uniref:CPBP family intramembrane glutamic endopeptidase n=1 Tax=Natrarchaeobius versutus TaxID=1679078 RepID=UPI00350FC9D0
MGDIREGRSTRLRAGLRAVAPAVTTLLVLLVGLAVLAAVADAITERSPTGGMLATLVALSFLYVLLIAIALWLATKLDRRRYASYGLDLDVAWLRAFAVGAGIGFLAAVVSVGYGAVRGFVDVDLSAGGVAGPGGPITLGLAVAILVGSFLIQNVYEEVVYRGIAIRNFVEGLTARGLSPTWAVLLATAASLFLFGLFHIPLRGDPLEAMVTSALLGTAFALAYVLTGELALPIGVHFGGMSIELAVGEEVVGLEVLSVVTLEQSAAASLEFLGVRVGLLCALIVAWVYLTSGDVGIDETVYRRDDDRLEAER